MQDIETIRARVDRTASRLAEAESERRERTSSLVGMLQRLEDKYARQEEELSYYRDRMAPMEQANSELAGLMGKLLDMIDAGFELGSQTALQEAAAIATQMLDSEASGASEATGVPEVAEIPDFVSSDAEEVDSFPESEAEPEPVVEAPASEFPLALAPEEQESACFEDVSEGALDFELEEEGAECADDLPGIVTLAVERAADDGMAGQDTDEIDITAVAEEIAAAVSDRSLAEDTSSPHGTETSDDIKALLARVEALAAKAELMRSPEATEKAANQMPHRAEAAA
jgi:hypothetical protein